MPPMMGEEEEPPMMDDQFNEGQQFGAMTGMPDVGNLSIGNATGTGITQGSHMAVQRAKRRLETTGSAAKRRRADRPTQVLTEKQEEA